MEHADFVAVVFDLDFPEVERNHSGLAVDVILNEEVIDFTGWCNRNDGAIAVETEHVRFATRFGERDVERSTSVDFFFELLTEFHPSEQLPSKALHRLQVSTKSLLPLRARPGRA